MRFRALLPVTLAALAANPANGPAYSDDRAGIESNNLAFVNRLTWGETAQGNTLNGKSRESWLDSQLHPAADDGLPPDVQAAIAAMEISQKPLEEIAAETRDMQLAIRDARKTTNDGDRAGDKGDVAD